MKKNKKKGRNKQEKKLKDLDLCIECRKPLLRVGTGTKKMPYLITCTNKECPRFGLLTVVSTKMVKVTDTKQKGSSDGDKKSQEKRDKSKRRKKSD